MSDTLEDVPVWLVSDTLVGLDEAWKALANLILLHSYLQKHLATGLSQ